jgi:hypothetical protein
MTSLLKFLFLIPLLTGLAVGQLPLEDGDNAKAVREAIQAAPKNAINVKDAPFNATGDGTTDDTAAIQAALDALEASTTIHRLVIPAGTYLLSGWTANSQTTTASRILLDFGTTSGLDGRDIEIVGEPGATLYSDVASLRCHILLVNAKMRSIKFRGLRFEKNPGLLNFTPTEPNGCDGVALVRHDLREINLVEFDACTFFNCHGATQMYNMIGNNPREKLLTWRMVNCQVLNPYGCNTTGAASSYGGGQQINIGPWVKSAIYQGNYFQGNADAVDEATNPDGVPKDGCHFGSPLHLTFSGNTVDNMGVEAVFQGHQAPLLNYFSVPWTVPAVGATQTLVVLNPASQTTYEVGQLVNVNGSGYLIACEVTAWNAGTATVTLENLGGEFTTADPGDVVNGGNIWDVGYKQGLATFTNNVLRHSKFETDHLYSEGSIIATLTRAVISGNVIHGGIDVKAEVYVPQRPQALGSVVSGNVIRMRPGASGDFGQIGITVRQDQAIIDSNSVVMERNVNQDGIVLYGSNNTVSNNTVTSLDPQINGYSSADRTVGFGEASGQSGNVLSGNTSRGMDVGIGAPTASQSRNMIVLSHKSDGDVLSMDPLAGTLPTATSFPFYGPDGTLQTMTSYDGLTDNGLVREMVNEVRASFGNFTYYNNSATPTLSVGDSVLSIATTAAANASSARSLTFSDAGGSVPYPRDIVMTMTLKGNITNEGDWMHVGHFVQPDNATFSKTSPHYIAGANEGRWMVQIRKKSTAFLEARMVWMTTAGAYTEGSWVEVGAANYNEAPKFLVIRTTGGLTRTVNAYLFHGTANGAGKPTVTDLEDATFIGTATGITGSYPGGLISCGFITPGGAVQTVSFSNPQVRH